MKLEYTGGHGLHFIAEHPDEPLRAIWRQRLADVIHQEIKDFLEEVGVALRTMEPGIKVLKSRTIEVTIEKPVEDNRRIGGEERRSAL